MKHSFSAAAALAATFSLFAHAASDIPTCGGDKKCPDSAPCCSQYGQCGVGAYCLGGCDPQYSFDLNSCLAAPVCQSQDFKMNSLEDVVKNTEYLGDSSKANWVSSGIPVTYEDQAILLTMAPSTVGTLLMSTHYVWYGKISATMTTSQGAGVVTAFILMSDVKDEIDFEFVGVDMNHAQSNYYFQGITDYDNGDNLTVSSDTRQNQHVYTIDWQPDYISWAIDGEILRTKNRNETYNSTTGQYHYPQSPSRIQLSLWPAGLESNGEGTVGWAGGLVDWDSPYMSNGYYYASVSDVSLECYDPPSGFSKDFGSKAYYYQSSYGTNDTVAIGNNNTILSSFLATGDNPSYCPAGTAGCDKPKSGSSTAAASKPTHSTQPETVPGMSGGGNAGNSGSSTESTDTSGSANSQGSGAGSSASTSNGNSGGGSTQFDQGMGSSSGSGGRAGTSEASSVVAGSAVALLGFFAAALMI